MGKQLPIIVSHYTIETGYAEEIRKLVSSLSRWNLEYHITPIKSLGTWRANSNYCAQQVCDMMRMYPDRDILRVDADAIFQRFPGLFLQEDFTADVAAHIHDFRWHYQELLGGTIFFKNIPTVRALVKDWAELCTTSPKKTCRNPDLLQELLRSGKYDVQFQSLPAEYCKIFDLMPDVSDPVIEHFQCSRKYREAVNRQGVSTRSVCKDMV